MKQFKIKENGFKEIRKQTLMRIIPMALIAVVVGLAIFEINSSKSSKSDINVYPIVVPIVIGALAFGLNKGIKRQKVIYDTYELNVDADGITREQANTPTIRLLFSDITKITKSSKGGFVITGKSITNSILVPTQIDDLTGLENVLNENCTIRISTSKPLIQRLMIPILFAVLGLMAVTYVSTNKILVALSGTILTIVMIFSFVKIQTNKNIDKKSRRSSYSMLIVILSIIGIMIFKLMNLA